MFILAPAFLRAQHDNKKTGSPVSKPAAAAPAQQSKKPEPKLGPAIAPKPGPQSAPKPGPAIAAKPGPAPAPKPGPAAAPKPGPAAAPKPAPTFTPPSDAKAKPDGNGTVYTSSRGEFHTGPQGDLKSVKTPSGTEAKFNSRGGVATIHAKNGMTIQQGTNGSRRIESTRADGARVVSDGHGRGYVEKTFTRGGRTFASRTYSVNSHTYTRVYSRTFYGGHYYYRYVPGYYYGPAFYGWAFNPWATPVAFAWGWGYTGWYGYYGAYFGPEPFYAGPSFWLTDYVLAANLQAAYAEQVSAPDTAGGSGITIPGNQAWTDTGKYLNADDEVNITASGAVSMGGGWTPLPPAGKDPNCGNLGGFPAGQLPCWSLIGRVGDGPIFYVGNGKKIQAQNSGELLLGVNDNILGDNTGNWYATIVAPNSSAPVASGDSTAKPSQAVLAPEVKQEIADQVQSQIVADKDAAANPSQLANDNQMPAALDPKHSVFIVSSTLSEQLDDGQPCSLTGGDVLTRISDTPDDSQKVRVLVTTAKKDDCATGTKFAMSIQDLQDMYNDFQAKMDDGLKQLAEKQGKNGIPTGPAAAGRANPDAAGVTPDPTAAASVQEQEQAANKAEADVDQATQPTGGN